MHDPTSGESTAPGGHRPRKGPGTMTRCRSRRRIMRVHAGFRLRFRPPRGTDRAKSLSRTQSFPAAAGASGCAGGPSVRGAAEAAVARGPAGVQRYPGDPGATDRHEGRHRRPDRGDGRAGHRRVRCPGAGAGEQDATHRHPAAAGRAPLGGRRDRSRRRVLPAALRRAGAPGARARRPDAAAAVHHPCAGCRRRRALPDGLRARAGCGRRSDRRAAFRRGPAGAAAGRRHRQCIRDAARRRRHLPAGARRRHRRPRDACRVVPGAGGHRAGNRACAGRRRARDRGRHDVAAHARIGRGEGRNRRPRRCAARRGQRRDAALHHARLPLPRRRCADHELPSAAFDAADAGVGAGRHRPHPQRLRPCDRATLPVLQLR